MGRLTCLKDVVAINKPEWFLRKAEATMVDTILEDQPHTSVEHGRGLALLHVVHLA
jgi:hypothetical protein